MLGMIGGAFVREAIRAGSRAPQGAQGDPVGELLATAHAHRAQARSKLGAAYQMAGAPGLARAPAEVAVPEEGHVEPASGKPARPSVALPPLPAVPDPSQEPALADLLDQAFAYLAWCGELTHAETGEKRSGWPNVAAIYTATAWAGHTHLRLPCNDASHGHAPGAPGRLVVRATPRLAWLATEGGSGKTEYVRATLRLCPLPRLVVEPTGPVVPPLIARKHYTLGLDEGDVFFAKGARHDQVRGVLNAGYSAGAPGDVQATAPRMWRNQVDERDVFGPVAMAALDTVQTATGDSMKTFLSRFIILRVSKPPEGFHPHAVTPADLATIADIAEGLAGAFSPLVETAAGMTVQMPSYMDPRTAQVWEPLFIVAALAGRDWPQRIAWAADQIAGGGIERDARAAKATQTQAHVASWASAALPETAIAGDGWGDGEDGAA